MNNAPLLAGRSTNEYFVLFFVPSADILLSRTGVMAGPSPVFRLVILAVVASVLFFSKAKTVPSGITILWVLYLLPLVFFTTTPTIPFLPFIFTGAAIVTVLLNNAPLLASRSTFDTLVISLPSKGSNYLHGISPTILLTRRLMELSAIYLHSRAWVVNRPVLFFIEKLFPYLEKKCFIAFAQFRYQQAQLYREIRII